MGTMLRSRQRDSFVLILSMEGDPDTGLCFFYLKKMTSVILPKFSEYMEPGHFLFNKSGRSCEDL